MADTKITGLTEQTAVTSDDLLVIVDDPGGSPATKKITVANLQAGIVTGSAQMITQQITVEQALILNNQPSDPTPPGGGKGKLYAKNNEPYFINASGSVYSLHGGWIPVFDTWTYHSADDPSYVFSNTPTVTGTYSPGMRVKLTQTTDKYFIITNVAITGSTSFITLYGGTDYDLANAAIVNPYYSREKAPVGFPLSPSKWSVGVVNTSNVSQATPVGGTWYNLGSVSITIPIGIWLVSYECMPRIAHATATGLDMSTTLSTANNSQSDLDFTVYGACSSVASLSFYASKSKVLNLVTKTIYYLNAKNNGGGIDNIYIRGDLGSTIINAVSAYL